MMYPLILCLIFIGFFLSVSFYEIFKAKFPEIFEIVATGSGISEPERTASAAGPSERGTWICATATVIETIAPDYVLMIL